MIQLVKDICVVVMVITLFSLWYIDHTRINNLATFQTNAESLFGDMVDVIHTLTNTIMDTQEQLNELSTVDKPVELEVLR